MVIFGVKRSDQEPGFFRKKRTNVETGHSVPVNKDPAKKDPKPDSLVRVKKTEI